MFYFIGPDVSGVYLKSVEQFMCIVHSIKDVSRLELAEEKNINIFKYFFSSNNCSPT